MDPGEGQEAGGKRKQHPASVGPKPKHNVTEYAFRCVFQDGKQLVRFLLRAACLDDSVVLDFSPADGLTMRTMDATGSAWIEMTAPTKLWEGFYLRNDAPCTRILFTEHLQTLDELCTGKSCLVLYELLTAPDRVVVRIFDPDADRTIRLPQKSKEGMERQIMFAHEEFSYPAQVTVPADKFKKEIDCCKKVKAVSVEFAYKGEGKERLVLTTSAAASNKDGGGAFETSFACKKVQCSDGYGQDDAAIFYSVSFLVLFCKLQEVSSTVHVSFGTEAHPLRLVFASQSSLKAVILLMNKHEGD